MESDIVLKSSQEDTPIQKARELILRGGSYASEEEARNAGLHCKDALIATFSRLHIGADFGDRAPMSVVTSAGLEMLQKRTGVRVLNDFHGLMTFENEPPMKFVSVHANGVVTKNRQRFVKAVGLALDYDYNLSDEEYLAFDLFGTAFFQKSVDARLLMLMMAVEALLEPALQPQLVQEHVEELIHLTKKCSTLSQSEIDSLIGRLQDLRKESIGQAGQKLANRLGNRKYDGQQPSDFFTRCYNLRSKLVHGHVPRPTRDEIASICGSLELFVGDLLSGPLLSIQL